MAKDVMRMVEGVWPTTEAVKFERINLVQMKVPSEAPPATREITRPSSRSIVSRARLRSGDEYFGVYDVARHSNQASVIEEMTWKPVAAKASMLSDSWLLVKYMARMRIKLVAATVERIDTAPTTRSINLYAIVGRMRW